MKHLFLALIIFGVSLQQAQAQWWASSKKIKGDGNYISKTRTVSNYDELSVAGSFDVKLVSGKPGNIKIQAEANLMEYILTEVSNGKLKISVKKGANLQPSHRYEIKIQVPFKEMNAVSLTGSGEIYSSEEIKARNFKVSLTGSGGISLKLNSAEVKGTLTGSGDIGLTGKTKQLECSVTGSGDFDASKLKAEKVKAKVTGSGDLDVCATQELKASVSGSGDISYRGNPKKQDLKTSGSGSIEMK